MKIGTLKSWSRGYMHRNWQLVRCKLQPVSLGNERHRLKPLLQKII